MIHVYKDYYCNSDGVSNIILYSKGIVKDGSLTKKENIGSDRFSVIGYYTNLRDMICSMIHKEHLKMIEDTELTELKDVVKELYRMVEEIRDALDLNSLADMLEKDDDKEE